MEMAEGCAAHGHMARARAPAPRWITIRSPTIVSAPPSPTKVNQRGVTTRKQAFFNTICQEQTSGIVCRPVPQTSTASPT
jgi:hypothetical protein